MNSGKLDIAISDFDYPLGEDRIAKYPLQQRDQAKLLVLQDNKISQKHFYDLPSLLPQNTLLVCNDTKVVHARILFKKDSGSTIEIFCLEPFEPNELQIAFAQRHSCQWCCLVGNNKRWKQGAISKTVVYESSPITLSAQRVREENGNWIINFSWNTQYSFAEVLALMGVIPLPPYLKREAIKSDNEDYQTIYANYEGSVATPTAGLHFTQRTFADLKARDIHSLFVTLHVGAGTFKPVNSQSIADHVMHFEKIIISRSAIETLLSYLDKNIVCVGTTSVRTLESLYWYGVLLLQGSKEEEINVLQWTPYENKSVDFSARQALEAILSKMKQENLTHISGQTQLIIAPGYRYRIVKGLVTNFHQPKSTLLLLVSALIGDKWRECYDYALANDFRFLSYGDACLFLP
jgi:S-adenosylmethionine:tRNA-ribosyltransferase-isomerase (queuine synthetase)